MSSALLGAALVGGASFVNANSIAYSDWQIWTTFVLLYCALLTSALNLTSPTTRVLPPQALFANVSLLIIFILPSFIILEAKSSPPLGVGLAYTLLCLAAQ